MTNLYPPQPKITDYSFLNPSKNFTKNVKNVLLAMALFFVTYLLLIALALGLLYVAVWVGIGIMAYSINWITVVIGCGIICWGLMFLAFLLKFVFSVQKDNNDSRVEITAQQHPHLFDFINRLAAEVKASSPKKVFIVPNVNAAVFYNSSFWSMFLPIKKNLEIGLGLVNSLNISEFKAVLAHEFGHFSQRSMKIGSYVYSVNRAIYNMVYEYDEWDKLLDKWVDSGGIFSLFARITRKMVSGVRLLLKSAYKLINIRYMGLSREMEYNADLIAVSAAGNEAAISALRRVIFGDEAYKRAIDQLAFLMNNQKRTDNIYEKQLAMIEYMVKDKNLVVRNQRPVLTDHYMQTTAPKNRVYFKSQWSSHPDQQDRENNINTVHIQAEVNEESPWLLFNNAEKLQREITKRFYAEVKENEDNTTEIINKTAFLSSVDERYEQYKYPPVLRHFYDDRFLFEINLDALELQDESVEMVGVFSEENKKLLDVYYRNLEDKQVLEGIRDGHIETQSFDFDGEKYNKEQAERICTQLDQEIEEQKQNLIKLENQAARLGYQEAVKKGNAPEFKTKIEIYMVLMEKLKTVDVFRERIEQLTNYIRANLPFDEYSILPVQEAINTLYKDVLQELEAMKKITMPKQIREAFIGESFHEYVLNEPLEAAGNGLFSFEKFNRFYNQLYLINQRINYACVNALRDFIYLQGSLFEVSDK